jgi:hypothetical protein
MDDLLTYDKKYKLYKVGSYLYVEEPLYAQQYLCILSTIQFKAGDRVFVVEKNKRVYLMTDEGDSDMEKTRKCYSTYVYQCDDML